MEHPAVQSQGRCCLTSYVHSVLEQAVKQGSTELWKNMKKYSLTILDFSSILVKSRQDILDNNDDIYQLIGSL